MNGADGIGFLDAAPFRAILEKRLSEIQEIIDIPNPNEQLAQEAGISARSLLRIRGQKIISFDNADRIVTNILGPMAWHEDEELNQIYEAVDLTALDWSFPVSERVRQTFRETASRSIKKLGTVGAAKTLGISVTTLSRYAREARASCGA